MDADSESFRRFENSAFSFCKGQRLSSWFSFKFPKLIVIRIFYTRECHWRNFPQEGGQQIGDSARGGKQIKKFSTVPREYVLILWPETSHMNSFCCVTQSKRLELLWHTSATSPCRKISDDCGLSRLCPMCDNYRHVWHNYRHVVLSTIHSASETE